MTLCSNSGGDTFEFLLPLISYCVLDNRSLYIDTYNGFLFNRNDTFLENDETIGHIQIFFRNVEEKDKQIV